MVRREKSSSIVLGYDCNNQCTFCLYGGKKGIRSFNEVKKSLYELRKNSHTVMLTGGSVFRDDYLDILQYASDIGFHIHIDNNARIFADKKFTKTVFKVCPHPTFSTGLHSHLASMHDRITQVKGSWEETVEGIKNIISFGPKNINIVTVICKMNYKVLPQLSEFIYGLGADQHHYVLVRNEGNAEKNYSRLLPSVTEFKRYLLNAFEMAETLRLPVKVYGLPICVIKDPKYSYELNNPNLTKIIWDVDGNKYNEIDGMIEIRTKFKKCKKCCYNYICMGPLKAYVDVYGKDEFLPVPGNYIRDLRSLKVGFFDGYN